MDGKWKLPNWEEDKAMYREIEADFEASLEEPLGGYRFLATSSTAGMS